MKKCELLAPAGGKEQYIAAVENGADAIYLGGQMMNARMSADNFDICQMEKAVDYGHLRNVKTYVTMNTLVAERELEEGVEYAYQLYKIGVDGIIIQDLGLGLAIGKNLPDMPLHLSTQATVYNPQGVKAAGDLGYERVVLARELSLVEIRKCCNPHIIDIEVFVHGALCFCYSGQCQLSRSIGGRSANRGTCAQPCRLPYLADQKNSTGDVKGYYLSPRDLSAVDFLGELASAGVASLKIEGRMKSPEYVATVVGIYRKYLDRFYEYGKYTVEEQDRKNLLQIFNRGGFTSSYLKGEYKDNVMAGNIPKHQGVAAGVIQGTNRRGNIGKLAPASGVELEQGDIFEIHPETKRRETINTSSGDLTGDRLRPISGTVTFLEKNSDGTLNFGDIKGVVNKGDKVYRIISSGQIKAAGETFKYVDFDGGKFRRKQGVKAVLEAKVGEYMKLTLETLDGLVKTEKKDEGYTVEEAKGEGTSADVISEKLSKTGSTPFEVAEVSCNLSHNSYIPASRLNQLRREAFEDLETEIKRRYKRMAISQSDMPDGEIAEAPEEIQRSLPDGTVEIYLYHTEDLFSTNVEQTIRTIAKIKETKIRLLIPLGEMVDGEHQDIWEKINKQANEQGLEIMFYLEHISKGHLDRLLEENFDEAVDLVRRTGNKIYVGNIGWIEPFRNRGTQVYGDFGLNICNETSAGAYAILGMSKWINSLEYDVCHRGTIPLMTIEHPMDLKSITDRKGVKYVIRKLGASGKTFLTRKSTKWSEKDIREWMDSQGKDSNSQGIRIYM